MLVGASGLLCSPLLLTACRSKRKPPAASAAATPAERSADDPAPAVPDGQGRPPLPVIAPVVRVRVHRVRGSRGMLSLGAADQWLRAAREGSQSRGVVLRGPLVVTLGAEGFSIVDGKGFRPDLVGMDPIEVASADPAEPIAVGGREHPGVLRLVPRTDQGEGALDLINHVDIEAYLPGVMSGELYDHWNEQTYMAQAIAARSLACAEHAYFADRRHYDLTNTTRSQVYAGTVAHVASRRAAEATRGQVLGFGGFLVPGYYCSCCGGVSARAVDAIGPHPFNDVPPLEGRGSGDLCTKAPVYAWTVERSVGDLSARLSSYGHRHGPSELKAIGRITAIRVSRRNRHGRPTHYVVAGRRSPEAVLTAGAFKRAANHIGSGMSEPRQRLKSGFGDAIVRDDVVIFHGHGFGHGVGMCQFGAEAQARSGRDHLEIIRWYYPGVEVVRAYA
jgi:SpoIID/LytB domain protein